MLKEARSVNMPLICSLKHFVDVCSLKLEHLYIAVRSCITRYLLTYWVGIGVLPENLTSNNNNNNKKGRGVRNFRV